MAPEDKPKDQLTGPQEENPQAVMRKSKEDRKDIDMSGKGGKGMGPGAAQKRQSKLLWQKSMNDPLLTTASGMFNSTTTFFVGFTQPTILFESTSNPRSLSLSTCACLISLFLRTDGANTGNSKPIATGTVRERCKNSSVDMMPSTHGTLDHTPPLATHVGDFDPLELVAGLATLNLVDVLENLKEAEDVGEDFHWESVDRSEAITAGAQRGHHELNSFYLELQLLPCVRDALSLDRVDTSNLGCEPSLFRMGPILVGARIRYIQ
ncbi:hypothetical protein DENSPDRAFT_869239 [Dentipellis sp. KUC8613]|nr:hypothetical protein DENSPDRAFT_869239 [Dentipellis sp. KUC8613]